MKLLQAARLSRLGDASTGLDKQDVDCQQYAKLGGHEIVAVAADTDVSGDVSPWDRPKLGPWLQPEMMSQYDGIIASHVDRLSRSTVDFMRLLHWADENGKVVITTGEQGIDFSSPVGKLLGYIISWLGEQELAAIKRRSIKSQDWLKINGYVVGAVPFGFSIIPKDEHKTMAPDPKLVSVLQEMVKRTLAGESNTDVAKWLDSEKVKPVKGDKLWSPKSVGQVLRNEALIGRRVQILSTGQRTLLKFPGVISVSDFNRLQKKLDSHPNRRGAASNDTALLTGVIFCAKCEGVMHRRTTFNKPRKDGTRGTEFTAYRCDGTPRQPSTCKNMIPLVEVDSWINDFFEGEAAAQWERVEVVTIHGNGHQDELDLIDRDIDSLDKNADDFLARVAELVTERKRIQALPNEADRTEFRPTGETMKDQWARISNAERRELLLDMNVKVYATKDAYDLRIGGKSAAQHFHSNNLSA